ncbi:MAG: class II aldolase/adducin family protein [Erysipelotrichaceae bacterium]|jgi:L-ribulose-5-phosphate 4-epimerase|nr:class II aldolase/adducin family protein [Erysipelotrichaceae bacterium]MCR5095996.1 class II aldolase/adducin family protein [Erysipelotrichaceae bacterium]
MLHEKLRQDLIDTARKMEQYNLIRMSGGNVALRVEDMILVTPTAMAYDTMIPEDIVVVDCEGRVIEGKRKPTSDLKAILYILNHMPEVNAVIHTHQPKAVALSLITDKLPLISTTMVDEVKDEVNVAPFTISSDEGMGIQTVEYATRALCVILKNHGIMAFGKDLEQALSAAIYLEESCEVYMSALATGKDITVLTKEQAEAEDAPRGYYGQ